MVKGRNRRTLLVGIVLVTALPSIAADWPRFRGPNGAGVADEHALPDRIQRGAEQWQRPVPPGHSSLVVANKHVYVTGAAGEELLTIAFDKKSGHEVWRRKAPRNRKEHIDKRNHPASPSPAADRYRVVVFFPDFGLLAYDHAGRELWRTPLGPLPSTGRLLDDVLGVAAIAQIDRNVLAATASPCRHQ